MKNSTKQSIFWALAAICFFGGFSMVALHDQINSIPLSNAVSVAGYIIGIAGTVGSLVGVNNYSKPLGED